MQKAHPCLPHGERTLSKHPHCANLTDGALAKRPLDYSGGQLERVQ